MDGIRSSDGSKGDTSHRVVPVGINRGNWGRGS